MGHESSKARQREGCWRHVPEAPVLQIGSTATPYASGTTEGESSAEKAPSQPIHLFEEKQINIPPASARDG